MYILKGIKIKWIIIMNCWYKQILLIDENIKPSAMNLSNEMVI